MMNLKLLAIGLAFVSVGHATQTSMVLVSHPANLGAHSDPLAIPISHVPVWANYNYGVHQHVGSPRPFPAGALFSRHGVELNFNLASVYGICLEPADATQVPGLPLTLRVMEGRDLPPDSPYTREQVLAATLWCLLLDVAGHENHPVVVKVDSQEPSMQSYAGEYVRSKEGFELEVGEIAGSWLERDARGVVWVVFEPEKHRPRKVGKPVGGEPPLVFIPLIQGGGAEGDTQVVLSPHWLGPDASVLQAPWVAIPRVMNAHSAKHGENANPLHGSGFQAAHTLAHSRIASLSGWHADEGNGHAEYRRMLAAAVHAMLASGLPTKEDPVTMFFETGPMTGDHWEFLAEEGWEPHEGTRWRQVFEAAPDHVAGHRLEPKLAGGFLLVAHPDASR